MNYNENPALILTGVWIGNAYRHMIFHGMIAFDYCNFHKTLIRIYFSVNRHGFSGIVFAKECGVNSHPLCISLMDFKKIPGCLICRINDWVATSDEVENLMESECGNGCEAEAEIPVRRSLGPDIVQLYIHELIGTYDAVPAEIKRGMAYTFRLCEDRTDNGVIRKKGVGSKVFGECISNPVTDK